MRALLQRVKEASVSIDAVVQSQIKRGMVIFLGVGEDDLESDALSLAQRCGNLRIFEDEKGKMNLSIKETGGNSLVVSQFTLYADTRKGNRPSFTEAAPPERAEQLYEAFVGALRREIGHDHVSTGVFRAMMNVQLINEGPVTVMVESKK
jgi:D-tyrosyl-tRNA(Tyr) deacylase